MDPKLITPILLAALVVWGLFRRVRRTFGRQRVQPARIYFRIGMLTLVGALVAATSVARNTQAAAPVIGGVVCGAAFGYLGLRHTRFEVAAEGRFYTPHTYIGVAVTALFLGRLLYRFIYVSYAAHATGDATRNLALAYQTNPLTLAIFALLIGYYVLFYVGVLVKTRGAAISIKPGALPDA